jgi:hypothetical protein
MGQTMKPSVRAGEAPASAPRWGWEAGLTVLCQDQAARSWASVPVLAAWIRCSMLVSSLRT